MAPLETPNSPNAIFEQPGATVPTSRALRHLGLRERSVSCRTWQNVHEAFIVVRTSVGGACRTSVGGPGGLWLQLTTRCERLQDDGRSAQ